MMLYPARLLAFFFALLAFHSLKAQDNLSDGPHVFYTKDSIRVFSVENGQAVKTVFPKEAREKIKLRISFSNAPEKNFEVMLKPGNPTEPCLWKQPGKMLVLSDIEGEFDALRNLLLANRVINKKYEWIFGKGHLVICGDLFDRGLEVSATLWLLYKLEQDAVKKGGYVHTILGNHDIMNLAGNFKYVAKKYFANSEAMGVPYEDFYSKDSELGKWLRSKNIMEKIGGNLCLHGGVSPDVNGLKLSVGEVNEKARPYIGWKDLKNTVKEDTILKLFNSRDGLFWFRGYFREPVVDEKVVDETLRLYGVERIIVGHTIVKTNVGFYYHQKVLGIDVNQHTGDHQGALYENKRWYKINLSGDKLPVPAH